MTGDGRYCFFLLAALAGHFCFVLLFIYKIITNSYIVNRPVVGPSSFCAVLFPPSVTFFFVNVTLNMMLPMN
jgi:hypothetical protein